MKPPLFTCAILCYNYGVYLDQAINSCLSQTISAELFEVLVIDDGSTDSTPEVCARYGGRIRVSRSENMGFARSLGRAVEESRGRYVCLLDADDWWHDEKLATLQRHLDADALLVKHPMHQVDAAGQPLGYVGSSGNTSSLCVQREAALTLLPAVTELFCHPLFDAGRGRELSKPLSYYRIHAGAMTDRQNVGKQAALFARTAHQVADRLAHLSFEPPFWAKSPMQLRDLSARFRAHALTKDLEVLIEQERWADFMPTYTSMFRQLTRARCRPTREQLRLVARFVTRRLRLRRAPRGLP